MGRRATETFSLLRGYPEEPSRGRGRGMSWPASPPNRAAGTGRPAEGDAGVSASMRQGDEVVFERLDLAEILGIWRHARGRVVGVHRRDGGQDGGQEGGQEGGATVDVQFQGHDTLERYLPDLFRRVH
jgi:hypothetical protein